MMKIKNTKTLRIITVIGLIAFIAFTALGDIKMSKQKSPALNGK